MRGAVGGQVRREVFLVLAAVLFVASWPLEKRHLFFTEYSFITGAYTEAGTMALYASDLAFGLLAATWLWYRRRSSPRGAPAARSGSVRAFLPRPALWAGGVLVGWSLFRAFPVGPPFLGTPALGLYGAARIAQGVVLAFLVADVWRDPRLRKAILCSLVILGVLQGAMGTVQVLRGSSLGLRFLGEPPLSLTAPGVAKVDIRQRIYETDNVPIETSVESSVGVPLGTSSNEEESPAKVLRAYGTFPHPNVLGAFLLAAISAAFFLLFSASTPKHSMINSHMSDNTSSDMTRTSYLRNGETLKRGKISQLFRLFRWEHIGREQERNRETTYVQGSLDEGRRNISGRLSLLQYHAIYVFIISLLVASLSLTFSRVSWVSFLFISIGLVLCFYRNIDKGILFISLLSIILGVSFPLMRSDLREAVWSRIVPPGTDPFFRQRLASFEDASYLLGKYSLFGVGTWNGIPALVRNMRNIDKKELYVIKREPWQYQYPHSVPAVVALELGIVGLGMFAWFLETFTRVGREISARVFRRAGRHRFLQTIGYLLIVVGVAGPFFADHYLWTIQQGRILFFGLLGVLTEEMRIRGSTRVLTHPLPPAHQPLDG